MKTRLLAVLLLSVSAFATTPVTGHIAGLDTTTPGTSAFVRFILGGMGGNQPRITATGAIAPLLGGNGLFYVDLPANASGNISGTIYSTRDAAGTGNGDIEVGGSYTAVYYRMFVYNNGIPGPEIRVHAKNGVSLDIANVTPITTNPVVTAPTGDTTYFRLDGGNSPITGAFTAQGNNSFTGSNTFSGLVSFLGGGTFGGTFSASATLGWTANPSTLNAVCIVDGSKNVNVDACVNSFGTNQGRIFIPSTYAGATQSVFSDSTLVEDVTGLKALIGVSAPYHVDVLFESWGTAANATSRNWPIGSQVHATGGGDGVTSHAEMVAMFAGAERTGGSRPIWGENTQVQYVNLNAAAKSHEADVNNNSGSDVAAANILLYCGYCAVSGGTNAPGVGFAVTSTSTSDAWIYGAYFSSYKTIGIYMQEISGFAGTAGIYYLPAASNTKQFIELRNVANNADVWSLFDNGNITGTGIISQDSFTATGGAVRAVSAGQVNYSSQTGFGNGAAGTAVTTTAKGTGSGPTTAQTIVAYIAVSNGGTTQYIPLMQ